MHDVELMRDIDRRYQQASGLASRDHYSIFYGPLMQSRLVMINANPGGAPTNYNIVDTFVGQHEYIEGRHSGPTTRNGARMLEALVDGNTARVRRVQVLNRFFRRSAARPSAALERDFTAEARPFVTELLLHIKPEAIIFGGDAGVALMAKAHGGSVVAGPRILGPNGTNQATYLGEYELRLPYMRPIPAYGIYHPSKMNGHFEREIIPLLKDKLASLID